MSKLIGNKFSSEVTSLTTSFTSSGTLTTSPHTTSAQYLVVGGGGSGGGGSLQAGQAQWCFGGGGGAGGFRTNVPGATSGGGASAEPSLTVSAGTTYPIVVGAGGAGGTTYSIGHNGHGSSFGPDPDANTSLLVKSDTTDGSTTFTDSSSNAHSITVGGDTQHKTDQQRIGNSSMYFDGTGDYLEIADHTSLDLDGGDFTIECWFRCDDVDSPNLQSVLSKWQVDSNCSYYLLVHPTAQIRWYLGNGSNSFTYVGTATIADKTWYHAALTKDGDVFTSYLDGTEVSSITFTTFADNDLTFRIGTDYANGRPYKGYIDEVRISKGVERYTGNFDPTRADYITALGGGGSASAGQGVVAPYAQPHPSGYQFKGQYGGSGGGGGFYNNPGPQPAARAGAGTPGQGYAGGTGSGGANVSDGGGGGGGAGAVGTSRPSEADGGAGQSSSISGSAVTYAGGGGGSRSCHPQCGTQLPGDGGSGGGGNGGKGQDGPQPPSIPGANQATCRVSSAGTINTGGGGGGNSGARFDGVHGSVNDRTAPGANQAVARAGGSGIVIVKEVVPGSITTYNGSLWKAGGIWNARDVYKERVKDNWG